jgi:PAS domain S-box-containing protein
VEIPKDILSRVEQEARNHPDALVALASAEGVFMYVSPSVKKILGHDRDFAIGKSYTELYPPLEAAHIGLTIQDALLRGESVQTTRNTPLKGGGSRRMIGSFTAVVDEETGTTYILSIARMADW